MVGGCTTRYRLVYEDGTEKIFDDFEEAFEESASSEESENKVVLFENIIG